MKSKISWLTTTLIILSLISLFLTFNSYSYYKHQAKLYSDMIYAEPTEDVISAEDMSRLFKEELNNYVLVKFSNEFSDRLDGERQNMYLSYSHYARNEYLTNKLASIIFIVLSILSWKVDQLKKKS